MKQLLDAKFDGVIEFEELRSIKATNKDGDATNVVMGRAGEIKINDPATGKTLISNHVPYGAFLAVKNKKKVKKGDQLM